MDAFKISLLESPELKWKKARDMFTRKQLPGESVNSYFIRLQKLERYVDADEVTKRPAFVGGLLPSMRSAVLLQGTTSCWVLEVARLAKGAGSADPVTTLIQEQIRSTTQSADKHCKLHK